MDTLIIIIVVLLLAWAGTYGYQTFLGQQLSSPVNRTTQDHPTIVIQKLVSTAAGRGWGTELQGTTVVAKHSTGARVLIEVQPAGQGSSLSGRITDVRRGSIGTVKTYKSGQSLLRKREQLVAAG
ncbi:hypothetical protein C5O27_05315 [Gordonia alkanivorans]|uniref:hypothetical protein n=1 Tax=Gordonia alkanivorans TaxID=84096 RepID=UPI000FDE9914|nr:hypothetical protein [Gordonia alkanivorans]AZZ80573.1 hypothetical protein C5O27_05315 [Gordonia alkanivorans]